MKVIVTSDLTIFEELRTLGEKRGFFVEKYLALNIKTKEDINKDELEYIKTVNNMIFQSKNAVKNIHDRSLPFANGRRLATVAYAPSCCSNQRINLLMTTPPYPAHSLLAPLAQSSPVAHGNAANGALH